MWVLNTGKPVKVPPLSEAMAIELGSNILGEGIIFLIAAVLLLMEYSRQVRKEERKEKARKDELNQLYSKIYELKSQMSEQEDQIMELYSTIQDLGKRVFHVPWTPQHVPKRKDPEPTHRMPIEEYPTCVLEDLNNVEDEFVIMEPSFSEDIQNIEITGESEDEDVLIPSMSDTVVCDSGQVELNGNNETIVIESKGTVVSALTYVLNDILNLDKWSILEKQLHKGDGEYKK